MNFTRPYTGASDLTEKGIIEYFFKTKAAEIEREYRQCPPAFFRVAGGRAALSLFHRAAQRVPAYKDFLSKHKISPDKIKTIRDFSFLPIVDKHNYLRAYPVKDLCFDGDLGSARIISCSSGSTGEPFFWPRGTLQEVEGAQQTELICRILGLEKPTLIIIGFALGNWISGSFMYLSCELVSKKGYPLTMMTAGFSKRDILRSLKLRGPDFSQVVLMGYPPLIKDILDEGQEEGVDWKKFSVKYVFAAEGFSEKWRAYVYEKGGGQNYLHDSVNIYGSADAGILAFETPFTLAVRLLLSRNEKLHQALFSESRVPTLAQYDPRLRYFEAQEGGDLIFTANAGLPLIRYGIGDYGGIYEADKLKEICAENGVSVEKVLSEHRSLAYDWSLPSVYVFGRKDFTATLYGANIYPESVREALLDSSIKDKVTGKFTMFTKNDRYLDQFLSINVELKSGISPNKSLSHQVQKAVIGHLRRLNSEYSKIYDEMNHRAYPEIVLFRHGEGEYFQPGTKHRWTRQN